MDLTNKDIAEGMRVTNSHQLFRVNDWEPSYKYALLQKLDSDGNRTDKFLIIKNYTLSGTPKSPQLDWVNIEDLIETKPADAEEYFLAWYKYKNKPKE